MNPKAAGGKGRFPSMNEQLSKHRTKSLNIDRRQREEKDDRMRIDNEMTHMKTIDKEIHSHWSNSKGERSNIDNQLNR